jgi:multidrug resistance efflux pump
MAEEALAMLTLTAPRDGIVVVEENRWEDRKYQVGDTVFPGWTVLGIPDLDRLRVRGSLSDVDDGRLEIGATVRCTPDIEPELELEGTVTEITPIAREQRVFSERRGFDVIVELVALPDGVLLVPGMSVRIEVDVVLPDRLLIPRAAIDFAADPPRARRAGGTWTSVTYGPCSALQCSLLEGLEEGDLLAPVSRVDS